MKKSHNVMLDQKKSSHEELSSRKSDLTAFKLRLEILNSMRLFLEKVFPETRSLPYRRRPSPFTRRDQFAEISEDTDSNMTEGNKTGLPSAPIILIQQTPMLETVTVRTSYSRPTVAHGPAATSKRLTGLTILLQTTFISYLRFDTAL
jgi:hypothetical protein